MKLIKLTSAVAALTFTVILATSSARAQTAGDLIIGFEEPGSGGSANVYEVDLGAATLFLNPSSQTQTFALSTADLSNYFGSSWASSSLLQFGIIGGTQTSGDLTLGGTTLAKNTLFTSWNTWAAAPAERVSTTQQTTQLDINALYNDVANVAAPTAGSTVALPAVITDSTDAGGIAYQNAHKSNFNFGTGAAKSNLDSNSDGSISAVDNAILDLYELTPTDADTGAKPTTLLGTLNLNSNGNLVFTAAAVPEPSSWSMIGLGALTLVWSLRRRNQRGSAV
ncbi:MAG TPA: PEP-CTERM sorting domain-containing protein [Candidatus Methylacidiphilales bacterium]